MFNFEKLQCLSLKNYWENDNKLQSEDFFIQLSMD